MKASLISRLEEEVKTYTRLGLASTGVEDLIPKWKAQVGGEPQRFIKNGSSINVEALTNFRRLAIFIPDTPAWDTTRPSLKSLISSARHGGRKMLKECLSVLQQHGYQELLRKYPCSTTGNPYIYEHQGYRYTLRWFKHIYSLGLMNRVLRDKLPPSTICMDIGSSYGIFSSLVKQEYPSTHHVLVDFPEQLVLAYYFLATSLPEARIAGITEVCSKEALDRDFIDSYDFVLVPCSLYQRLTPESVDLVTNFASLGEMSRTWFDNYLKSPAFLTAKYFFTANRVQSYPTYETDLTILDYPIWDPAKRLHFGICPAFSGYYEYSRKHLFFSEREAFPAYFEYIGKV